MFQMMSLSNEVTESNIFFEKKLINAIALICLLFNHIALPLFKIQFIAASI